MSVQSVDDNGELWFLSGRDSDKNESISRDPRVQLMFANPDKYEFLSLEGTAAIHTDRAYREKYWTELAKAWFKGGIDDPNLSVLQVTPAEGYYWDTKSGKTMTLFKILAGALTGKDTDGGVSGKLKP
jgi:general stress protein 26